MPRFGPSFRPSTTPLLLVLLIASTGASECEQGPLNFVFLEGPQRSTLTEAQMLTMTATARMGSGAEIVEVRFIHNGEVAHVGLDDHPYRYDWSVDGSQNGTHRWMAEVLYAWPGGQETMRSQELVYQVDIAGRRSNPPPTSGTESVCNALDDACVCSEPLDVQQSLGQGLHNPADSDRECAGGDSIYSATNLEAVSAFGMPAASSVGHVWRTDYGRGGIATVTGNTMTLANGTVCTRIYQRLSSDYPLMGNSHDPGNERNKLLEMTGPWGQFQTQFWPPDANATFNTHVSSTQFGYSANFPKNGDRITIQDCKDHWCRMEQCVDHSGTTATFRTRAAVVGTNKVQTGDSGPIQVGSSLPLDRMWIGNLYRETVYAGSRFISHAMQAHWPDANGEWIGPACEVEGTSEWGTCP